MRGKHGRGFRCPMLGRIIPAHAGQTLSPSCHRRFQPDHPRACGANRTAVSTIPPPNGSSPRMRGKQLLCGSRISALRIIPAHAGQTHGLLRRIQTATDHPRACGANCCCSHSSRRSSGSSPRMRGKRRDALHTAIRYRIIPAHAGQTPALSAVAIEPPDHPRACGANPQEQRNSRPKVGSSPRMRGKQSDFMRKLLSAGPSIIGFAQWLQSSYYCSCLQSSAKTPISRGTTPTSLFLGFQNSITLLLLT